MALKPKLELTWISKENRPRLEPRNWVVSKEYNGAMLAEALCKLEGFTYAPSETVYWQHGHSTERAFIYVTTQKLSRQRLAALSDEVGEERSLLVYCMAFRGLRPLPT